MTTDNDNHAGVMRAGVADEHAAAAKTSMVDKMAEEAKPPALPDDAPTMTPYLKLPYRSRAQFMAKMAEIEKLAPEPKTAAAVNKKAKAGNKVDLAEISSFYLLLAEIDELLRLVCDGAELDKWQAGHDDSEFVAFYNAYMRWSQAGEASSSAS